MATRANQRWPKPAKLQLQTRGRKKMDAAAVAASVARGVESPGQLDEDEDAIELTGAPHVEEVFAHRWDKNIRRPKRGPHIAIHPDQIPTDEAELERCLRDPEWRLFSGCLYQIIVKGDPIRNDAGEIIEEGESMVVPFRPNRAQKRFIRRIWNRNIILKARQLGFTTLIALMWLDEALFNGNRRCGMIAQDRETAEQIFRDKIVFAYDHLPEELRERFPLARASTKELLFAHNNSSIRVATSVRGGTIHRLHVSEFGKICAKFPAKADEVVTGSFQAVPTTGIIVVESTAEGTSGEFYDMCQRAMRLVTGKEFLTQSQYRFHFYAWWQDPNYRIDPSGVPISDDEHTYFETIEKACSTPKRPCKIDAGQRAWYVEKRRNDFAGNEERMWREYPSSPEEAFQQSTEGHYYAKQMVLLRKRGGVRELPILDLPVFTFWDIGAGDGSAVWFLQVHDGQDRFIDYYEEHDQDLRHYATMLINRGYTYGGHFLPHDADHKRLGDYNKSVKQQLAQLLPGHRWHIVPRVTELMTGIFATRKLLKECMFDVNRCAKGLERLANYKKRYSQSDKRYLDEPDKSNGCSEGADALRQYAQAKELNMVQAAVKRSGRSSYQEAPPPEYV